MAYFKNTDELIKYFEAKHFEQLNAPLSLEGQAMLKKIRDKNN
jgi:hypothetical protein